MGVYILGVNLDHFALSHICGNCPVRVNRVVPLIQVSFYTILVNVIVVGTADGEGCVFYPARASFKHCNTHVLHYRCSWCPSCRGDGFHYVVYIHMHMTCTSTVKNQSAWSNPQIEDGELPEMPIIK